ncbi:MAG: IS607 family transposase [Xenococcaceae cyanobacterium MO_188.B32]|nr:IS607 family transposase [Xenococcaceae cyanobacterium MO_188.B32]
MRPGEFAKRVGVSVKTLHRWDETGKLPAKRTPSGHRYYLESDLAIALGKEISKPKRKIVVYTRVSSSAPKSELQNQILAMEQFCLGKGLVVDEWISEIGGGLNFKRRKFLKLISSILSGEVETLIVAHKDRLCRFAYDFVEYLASENDCKILVVNQPSSSPQQELVEDLLSIVHCFSCRLYGQRNDTKHLTKDIRKNLDIDTQNLTKYQKVQC